MYDSTTPLPDPDAPTEPASFDAATDAVQPPEPTRGILLAKGKKWGRWTIKSHLASGGSAQVWRSNDADGNVAAVKFLVNLNSSARFQRELQLALLHDGQWAPAVIDSDLDDVLPWIAFEYLDRHENLASVIESSGPLNDESACAFARDLWDAVLSLHESGISHRDLSARNVLVGPEGRPRFVDLGLGKSGRSDETATQGPLGGSPGFASPEQLTGEGSGKPADYWAWAAVTAFASSGQPILQAANAEQYRHAIYARTQIALAGVAHELQPALAEALRYEPADRRPSRITSLMPPRPHERELLEAQAQIDDAERKIADLRAQLDEPSESSDRDGRIQIHSTDAADHRGDRNLTPQEAQQRIADLESELVEALGSAGRARDELEQAVPRSRRGIVDQAARAQALVDASRVGPAPVTSNTRSLLITFGISVALALAFAAYLMSATR